VQPRWNVAGGLIGLRQRLSGDVHCDCTSLRDGEFGWGSLSNCAMAG
jgi:hypothetical protein